MSKRKQTYNKLNDMDGFDVLIQPTTLLFN